MLHATSPSIVIAWAPGEDWFGRLTRVLIADVSSAREGYLMKVEAVLREVRAARARLAKEGPAVTRPIEGDFDRVSLPERECDVLRDVLVAEGACVVIEVGLAYGSSALAIAEAVLATCGRRARHVMIDPFQVSAYSNVGWELLRSAGLEATSRLLVEASSLALPRLLGE